jgi:hypothetical protein
MSRVGSSSSIAHNKHGGINAATPKAPHHHGCGGCYEHGVNLCEADAELRETVAGTIADFSVFRLHQQHSSCPGCHRARVRACGVFASSTWR